MDARSLSPSDRDFCDAVFDAIDSLSRVRSSDVKWAKGKLVKALAQRNTGYFISPAPEVTLTDAQWDELEQTARIRGSFIVLETDDDDQ